MTSQERPIEQLIAARLYGGPTGHGDRITMLRITEDRPCPAKHADLPSAHGSARGVVSENRVSSTQAMNREFWQEVVHLDPSKTHRGESLRVRLRCV